MAREKNVGRFNADVSSKAGYLYTRGSLSGTLANRRIGACVAEFADLKGARVLDLGCGDGTYSAELKALGAKEVLGVDAAEVAVRAAAKRYRSVRGLSFRALDVYKARAPKRRYDIMVVRGLLHHLYDVQAAIRALAPLAKVIVVVEPNGYNPVLKVIEKTSRYHIEHEEKSYAPHRLDAWFAAQGGRVTRRAYIGLVPFFCPDWMAKILKRLEPWVEAIPGLKQLGCAQYVMRVEMD